MVCWVLSARDNNTSKMQSSDWSTMSTHNSAAEQAQIVLLLVWEGNFDAVHNALSRVQPSVCPSRDLLQQRESRSKQHHVSSCLGLVPSLVPGEIGTETLERGHKIGSGSGNGLFLSLKQLTLWPDWVEDGLFSGDYGRCRSSSVHQNQGRLATSEPTDFSCKETPFFITLPLSSSPPSQW